MKTNAKLCAGISALCATAAVLVALGPTDAEAQPQTLSDTELAQINGGGPFSTCGTTTPSCPNAAECLPNGTQWRFTQNNGFHACSFSVWGSCAMLDSHPCLTRFYDGPGCTNLREDLDLYSDHDSCD